MIIYLVTYLLTFFLTRYCEILKEKYQIYKNKWTFAGFLAAVVGIYVILTLPAVFRYGIGLDYNAYYAIIERAKLEGVYTTNELLTNLIGTFVIKQDLDPHYFLVIFSILTNIGFVSAIFINKDNKFVIRMFILLFYCLYITSYNQVRQSFGIAFGALAFSIFYNYNSTKSIFIAYIIAFISMLTHYSEIINIFILSILYFFRYQGDKIPPKKLISFGLIVIIVSPIIAMLIENLLQYIPIYSQYADYLSNGDRSTIIELRFFGSFGVYVVPIVGLFYYITYFQNENDNFMKTIFIYLIANISFMFVSMLLTNLMFADRARTMIYAFELISFPYFISKLKGLGRKSFKVIAMSLMVIITIGTYIGGRMYPYKTIFDKDLIIY